MLYKITDGTLSAGGQTVLSHFDFEIRGHERIAVVGKNGAGKTTLLRLIAGELTPDRDDRRRQPVIYASRSLTVGMLSQQVFPDLSLTAEDLIMSAAAVEDPWSRERFDFEQRYDRMMTAFGFSKEDKKKTLGQFSGGEQTRIGLIRLLLSQPDILLLDEPTNHLDMGAVRWLEKYLKTWPGAVVMVSHDRFFLDETAQVIYELEGGKLTRYAGNYTDYRREKLKRLRIQEKTWARQQEEVAREEALIRKFKGKPRKASFARSRKKLLERMDRVEKPEMEDCHIFTGEITPETAGPKWVLTTEKLKAGYDRPLFSDLSIRIRRGQKIAVIGPNGAGKTTFLKTAAGLLPALSGSCVMGENVFPAYFDQHSADLRSEDSVLHHFMKHFPILQEKEARNILAAWLFRGRDVYKRINDLSGGEKSRLVLAELMQERPNLMLLDEPTNHMDISAKETIESALRAYTGTLIIISHDRYLVDRVADALLILEKGEALWYPFAYRHYLERKEKAGGSLSAMVSAKDQALIEGLRNVPEGSSLLGRELSESRLYEDWRMRLAAEAVTEAGEKVFALQAERNVQNNIQLEKYLTQDPAEDAAFSAEIRRITQALDRAVTEWEQAILAWYDLTLEFSPPETEKFDNNQTDTMSV